MNFSFKYLILNLLALCLFSSCQKAIDLHLETAPANYIIAGVVSNEAGGDSVMISQTQPFTVDNSFTGVSGAQVSIDNNGTSYQLTEISKGIYKNVSLAGTPGNTYTLTIKLGGKTYSAVSTMPQVVPLDSIYVIQDKGSLNHDRVPRKFITVRYQDPPNEKNYYRFIQYLNNVQEQTVFVDNDEFTNGQTADTELNYGNPNNDPAKDLKSGDQVTIAMLTISQPVYEYWYSLTNSASGSNNAAPSNPVSNIQSGVLGYFSAQTIQHKSMMVK